MKFFVKLCFIYLLSIGCAHAQTQNLETIFSQNPELLQGLNITNTSKKGLKNNTGIPNAINPRILNSQDIKDDRQNIFQTKDVTKKTSSTLSNYYKILTGFNLPIYGAAEFNQEEKSELLFFNTMSRDYQLAAGDILRITMRGLLDVDEVFKIGRDNNLILSGLPPINVNGLTISRLEEKLAELLKIDDASALVNVSLDAARLVTVQVSGNVDFPRTLAVPAYTPLSRVISYAGGISDTGSLRNITFIESDGTQSSIDFYAFLQNPFNSNDPLISSNARIFVGAKGATIAASGYVARPGIFELAEGQKKIDYTELLKMAGTTLLPPGVFLQVRSFDKNGVLSFRDLTKGNSIFAGEALHLDFVETKNLNKITVSGAVLKEFTLATRQPISVFAALRGGAVLKPNAIFHFAIISGQNIETEIINLSHAMNNENIKIPVGGNLNVFEKFEYQDLIENYIKNPNTSDNLTLRDSNVASIYIDGELKKIFAPGGFTHSDKIFRSKLDIANIYKLYSIHAIYDEIKGSWSDVINKVSIYKDKNLPLIVGKKDRFDFYTENFINNVLFSDKEKNNLIIKSLNSEKDKLALNTNNSEDLTLNDVMVKKPYDLQTSFAEETLRKENIKTKDTTFDKKNMLNIDKMRQASKLVSGAVYFPGFYPIADNVSLAALINQAGGLTKSADLDNIELAIIDAKDGKLNLVRREKLTYNSLDLYDIPDIYSFILQVNSLINNADIGTVTLSGEVQKPGEYRFSRSETLHDLIKRAGGFTEIAYPIGTIFTRKNIEEIQKENNQILANKIEKSILRLSQIEIGNAETQVAAILGFSQRLKTLKVSGRMSVNAILEDHSTPVYLENLDTVFVPKRPSHVSVIGAIGKETVGRYVSLKTVNEYFNDVGGLSQDANLKISYILLPNGDSKPLRKNSIIVPGSVLVVMPKTDKLSILGLTSIVSRVMGNIATSILAINNVN